MEVGEVPGGGDTEWGGEVWVIGFYEGFEFGGGKGVGEEGWAGWVEVFEEMERRGEVVGF